MSLKGNLQSVDLANVLQMLSINQKEGALVLFDGDNRKSIYFAREGVSMLSRGRRGQDSLGRILLRYGRVTEEILKGALEKQKAENKRLGEVLQEMGTVSQTDIEDAIQTQIEEEIYNLFIWKEASFEFVEGPPPPEMENVKSRVTFNVNSLIMEAQRRADEWNYIRGLVPSLDEIYRPTDKMAEAVVTDEVFHFPFAPRILEGLQAGRMNVNELIDASHAAKFEACKIVANLLEQGAIEPVTISDLQSYAQEASTKGDHAQAAKFLSRIVDLGGATPGVNMSLGYALEAMDEPERASIYFKAAGESYVESMESKEAFDAYQRIARALPTDLPAVARMVEIAFNTPDILTDNLFEVTEAGRVLAQVFKELGRLPAAIQVLNSICQANPQDMPLRNLLVQAYVDSGMSNEAMTELESMADACIAQKNLDEAIRCLRRVISIDRTRAGVQKKIESLTRSRDSGKRLVMRIVAAALVVVAAGTGWWGFTYYTKSIDEDRQRVNNLVSSSLDPLLEKFKAHAAAFDKSAVRLDEWKLSTAESVAEDVGAILTSLKAMEAITSEMGKKADALYAEHQARLPLTFVDDRTSRIMRRLVDAREKKENVIAVIEDGVKTRYLSLRKDLEVEPLRRMPEVEKLLNLLKAVNAPTKVLVENRMEDIADVLKKLQEYAGDVSNVQKKADDLWAAGKFRESHEILCAFLGPVFSVREFNEILNFQVRVTVVPAKAEIQVIGGPEPDAARVPSPRDLKYTVAGGLTFRVSAEGFQPKDVTIPAVKGNYDSDSLMKQMPWEMRVVLTKVPTWTSTLGSAGIDAPPVPTPDEVHVVAVDRNGWLHLVKVEDGSTVRSYDAKTISGFQSAPLVTADSVYALTVEGAIFALELPTLKERWKKAAVDGPGECYGTPVMAGGMLIAAGRGGTVMAFDPATGEVKWTVKLDAGTRLPLLFARDWIVATCEDGRARAISLDGKEIVTVLRSRTEEAGYAPPRSRTLALGGRILMGLEGNGQEFSLVELPVPGAASPHLAQKWVAGVPGAEVAGACPAGDDVYLLFSDGTAWRVSPRTGPKQGDLRGRATPEKEFPVGAPSFRNGSLFVATAGGLAAVKPGVAGFDEAWKWSQVERGPAITTPAVCAGKLVLVGTRDGRLLAFLQE